MEKYGFGNLEENEIHFLACFADLLSEPLLDLSNFSTINSNRGNNKEKQDV